MAKTKRGTTGGKIPAKSSELTDEQLDGVAGGADGINYLVSVTQMKANNANEDALHGAEDQRALVKQKKAPR